MIKTIAEIGINHNADMNIVKKLIDVAATAGVDVVKFQKRTPELCVPDDMKNTMRDTPWGRITYLDYRYKMEFTEDQYHEIDRYCKRRGIAWTASVWDIPSLDLISNFIPPFIKIPSALITNYNLLNLCKIGDNPIVMSTGMADWSIIDRAVQAVGPNLTCIMHCVSTYPSRAEEQNLRCIPEMIRRYPQIDIGFSNHFPGVMIIPIAVAFGAVWIEFHITLDRAMWGTDQAASIEPEGVFKIVKYCKTASEALGDGKKEILPSEIPIMQKLRRIA